MCVRVGVAVRSARSCVSVSLCVCVSDFFLRVFVCGCVGASAPVMACSWCVRDWSTPQAVSLGVGTHVSMIVSKKRKLRRETRASSAAARQGICVLATIGCFWWEEEEGGSSEGTRQEWGGNIT